MKTWHKFKEVSPLSVSAQGWLYNWLKMQVSGLTGHIEAAGYPFDGPGWETRNLVKGGQDDWWPFEQTGYWLDGAVRCAALTGDKVLLKRVQQQFDYVLNNPDKDGYLGPYFMKPAGDNHRWPHSVFFRALMHYAALTGDVKIYKAAAKHYKSKTSPHTFHREICNVEAMLAVYAATGDKTMLAQAVKTYDDWNAANPNNDCALKNLNSAKRPKDHGVSYNEFIKLPVLLYLYTGKTKYLKAAQNGYAKLFKDMMIIDGVCLSSEHLDIFKNALDSHETCDISAQTWGLGYMFMATGDVKYADIAESAILNALPAAVNTHTFGGLQYFSAPNQTVAANNSNHNLFHRGQKWMSFRPNPGTECCPGEVNRAMPNYVLRQFMADDKGNIAAVFYGPQTINALCGKEGIKTQIKQETAYPFSPDISFYFDTQKPVNFTFSLRIPQWCKNASLSLNGKPLPRKIKSGAMCAVKRVWRAGDKLTLTLPMEVKSFNHKEGGVYFKRGPLLFALRIEEDWQNDKTEKRQSSLLPAYNLYAKSPWNYAALDTCKPLTVFREIKDNPWTIDTAPVELIIPAVKIKGWQNIRAKKAQVGYADWDKRWSVEEKGDFIFTPPLPSADYIKKHAAAQTEFVRLVPYGCTHLRITVFPLLKK